MPNKVKPIIASLLFAGLSCILAQAQSGGNYCEPPAAVREEIRKTLTPVASDDEMLYKQRQERLTAILQELSKKYPDDFTVRRRVLNNRRSVSGADQDALIAEYRAQAEKNPDDPAATYF